MRTTLSYGTMVVCVKGIRKEMYWNRSSAHSCYSSPLKSFPIVEIIICLLLWKRKRKCLHSAYWQNSFIIDHIGETEIIILGTDVQAGYWTFEFESTPDQKLMFQLPLVLIGCVMVLPVPGSITRLLVMELEVSVTFNDRNIHRSLKSYPLWVTPKLFAKDGF